VSSLLGELYGTFPILTVVASNSPSGAKVSTRESKAKQAVFLCVCVCVCVCVLAFACSCACVVRVLGG
jgi:hypothetical protein